MWHMCSFMKIKLLLFTYTLVWLDILGNVHLAPQRSCSLNGGEKVFHRWGTFCRRVHILMQLFSNANRRDWWSGVDRLHSQAKAKASGTLDAYGKSGESITIQFLFS